MEDARAAWQIYAGSVRTKIKRYLGRYESRSARALLVAFVLVATGAIATPAFAFSCPDEDGHSLSNPVDVTYYLTATSCTKTDPGTGVLLSARIKEGSAERSVTFQPPTSVATSLTTGLDCTDRPTPTIANIAGYASNTNDYCSTTIRLTNGATMRFVALNLSDGYASKVEKVGVSIPTTSTNITTSTISSVFGQPVSFSASVRGSPTTPVGAVQFLDNGALIGSSSLAPVAVPGVVALAAGFIETCAVSSLGEARCWGGNAAPADEATITERWKLDDVSVLKSGVQKIAINIHHSCAITLAGGVKCWGLNAAGQLGNGTLTNSSTPVDVIGLSAGVTAISVGLEHSCALTASGSVKCWGNNYTGALGDGTGINRSSPVDVVGLNSNVIAISVGTFHSCALISSGAVRCWGRNGNHQLGDGTGDDRLIPTGVSGLGFGVTAIAAGEFHTCALLAAGGAKCWGANVYGALGDGTTLEPLVPVYVDGLGSGSVAIVAAGYYNCVLNSVGGVKCWGLNREGQLGNGTYTDYSGPVDVSGLSSGVSLLAAGNGHVCALLSSGGVRCWGYNNYGNLGDGSQNDRSIPVDVIGFPDRAATATFNIASLGAGSHNISASYTGSGSSRVSASEVVAYSVSKAGTATSISTLPVSAAFGQSVTLTATVSSGGGTPSGTITFTDSTNGTLGTATLNAGVATLSTSTLLAGSHTVTATYSGSANFEVSAGSQAYTVNKAGSALALSASPASSSNFGQAVTLAATVTSVSGTPSGTVTFTDNISGALGTVELSDGAASVTTSVLSVGAHTITATYSGAANFGISLGLATYNINKVASTTALAVSPNPVLLGGDVTATATVTGTGATGSVTFKDGANDVAVVALVNGAATAILSPPIDGLHPITAVYAGDPNVTTSTSNVVNLLAHSPCADAFAGALSLAGANGTVFGSTVGATGETGEPNHAGNSGALNSVWCTWTAPAAGTVTIDTSGSGFDTTLAVYTGASVDALTQVAANDNIGPGSTQSRVSFAATAGSAYRIAIDGVSATGDYVLNFALSPTVPPVTFASVLPTARSITTKTVATAFATIINSGAAVATGCSLSAPPGSSTEFYYQTTDATNAPSGTANTPVDIAAGAAQGFFFAVTPLVDLNSSEFAIVFDCINTPATVTVPGLNTLLLSSSLTPVPDLISIGATPSGDGIANIPGARGLTAFGAATVNIGATGTITASVDDNGAKLALTALLCVTDPATGVCTNPAAPASSVSFSLANGTSATVAVFVTGTGIVPFDPGNNRLFLRFKTADGVTRGATSVAVRTQ